jgi:hypothetical protein
MTSPQLVTVTKLLGCHKVWAIMTPYNWPVLMLDDGSHINVYNNGTSSRYKDGELIPDSGEDTDDC